MTAVNPKLAEVARLILSFKPFDGFYLAGGTSLALRFNHRESIDLDFFSQEQLGIEGFKKCEKCLIENFKEGVKIIYPLRDSDQMVWLRAILTISGLSIKLDFIQNMKLIKPVEIVNEIRIASVGDVGVFKLISATRRRSKKDFYDLDHITENHTDLSFLLDLLEQKEKLFKDVKTVFDLDSQDSPLTDLNLLRINRESVEDPKLKMPLNSNEILKVVDGSRQIAAEFNWNRKLSKLYRG